MNKSYVKSEMRLYLVAKLGIYVCLRYVIANHIFSFVSKKA